ncbi:MAG: tRNA 2-thiouridine(34) synthase MnmA, partial [Segetibacter sp.]
YKRGRTPNPDIMCNQEIKFNLFLETALGDGAGLIATGHYARIVYNSGNSKFQIPNSKFQMHMAVDTLKDQTYFLYRISEEALSKTLFPIGDFKTKAAVRQRAKKFGLATADKKDSQGICFVGKVGIKDFLNQYVEITPGDIIDTATEKIIGQHDGAIFYTLGQRHGLDVGGGLPYYVVGKDMAKNEVYVTTDLNNQTFWQKNIALKDIHWIAGSPAKNTALCVRLRHRGPLIECQLNGANLTLSQPQRAIVAGQSAVFYSDEQCLGGGIIS